MYTYTYTRFKSLSSLTATELGLKKLTYILWSFLHFLLIFTNNFLKMHFKMYKDTKIPHVPNDSRLNLLMYVLRLLMFMTALNTYYEYSLLYGQSICTYIKVTKIATHTWITLPPLCRWSDRLISNFYNILQLPPISA